ncbi:MAG: hypothetical protein IPH82_02635 [Chloroflexi bacterium]|nr:hypothetical protein [Chloroflexota bacterium]
MDNINQLFGFRSLGTALLVTVIVFMVGAFAADHFRLPIPTEPLEKLQRIANDRTGWTAQAIIFPVAFLATAVLFALIAAKLPSRWLAGCGPVLGGGFLFWLPISIGRLQLGAKAAELISTYDPTTPPEVMVNRSWLFWANTLCILAALALMGAALAVAGVLPTLGWGGDGHGRCLSHHWRIDLGRLAAIHELCHCAGAGNWVDVAAIITSFHGCQIKSNDVTLYGRIKYRNVGGGGVTAVPSQRRRSSSLNLPSPWRMAQLWLAAKIGFDNKGKTSAAAACRPTRAIRK